MGRKNSIRLSLADNERKALEDGAASVGVQVAVWVRMVSLAAAREILKDATPAND